MPSFIMEYGSTPYVEMAWGKMVAQLNVYKMTCSYLCCRRNLSQYEPYLAVRLDHLSALIGLLTPSSLNIYLYTPLIDFCFRKGLVLVHCGSRVKSRLLQTTSSTLCKKDINLLPLALHFPSPNMPIALSNYFQLWY